MNIKELKETDWYKERPIIIQDAINLLPPIKIYRFKDSKKQCCIVSFEEPTSGKLEDVTVTVQKTGVGGTMEIIGLDSLDTNKVFGVKLTDLEELSE